MWSLGAALILFLGPLQSPAATHGAIPAAAGAPAQVASTPVAPLASPLSRDAFEALLERRAPDELRAFARAHPYEVGDQAKGLLVRLCDSRRNADEAREQRLEASARFFADTLEGGAVADWLRAVADWSADDHARWESAREELASVAAVIETGRADDSAISVESIRQHAPEGGWPLCQAAVVKIANALFLTERRDLALPLVRALVESAERHQQGEYVLWGELWLGQIAWMESELPLARTHYARALGLARDLADDAGACESLCNLASIELSLGDVEGALVHASEAERVARAIVDATLLRRALQMRASALTEIGELQAALDLLSGAELGAHEPVPDELQVRLDILHSNTLSDVGRLESARTYIERALELVMRPDVARAAPALRGEVLLSKGLIEGDAHKTDVAIATLGDAIELYRSAGDPRGIAWAQKNLGYVLQGAGRHAEALDAFAEAMDYAQREDLPFLAGWSAMGRAESAIHVDPPPSEIESWLAIAERSAERLQSRHLTWRLEALRGELAARRGDDALALSHLGRAVDAIEKLRRRLDSPALLTHYLRDKSDPYRDAAFAAARSGAVREAWRYAELLRARVLSELRAKGAGAAASVYGDPRVASARRAVAQTESLARAGDGAQHDELTARVHAAEAELDRALLEAELAAPSALRLSGAGTSPFDVDATRAQLASNGLDVLIEFLVGERETLALVLTSERSFVERLPIGSDAIAERVERIRAPIEAVREGTLDLANLGFDTRAARELYDALLRPFESQLGARVALVPDGALASLPFELLVTGGASGPVDPNHPFAHLRGLHFVAHERALVYLPAARTIQPGSSARHDDDSSATHDAPRGTLICLAPQTRGLTSVPAEVSGLMGSAAQLFQPARLLQAPSAADVRREAGSARFLHFAAHGVLVADNPASSHLRFGSNGEERLEAWEIELLPLRAQLAVLSACHSGEGRVWSGEGLFGLTRSFLAAGVHEVVASAWAVEDGAVGEWMRVFYSELGRGERTADASRAARLAVFASDDPRGFARAHPYFWAAWVVHRGG